MENELAKPSGEFNIGALLFLLLVLLALVIYENSLTAEQYIELIHTLAWPIVILIIAFYFKEQISHFLRRMTHAKLPGGVELQAERETPPIEIVPANEPTPEQERIDFVAIDSSLVWNSKVGLNWISEQHRSIPVNFFLAAFQLPYPPAGTVIDLLNEKTAVIFALQTTGLIARDQNEMLTVTPKGVRFLRHIGFIA